MKKSDRIEQFVTTQTNSSADGWNPYYASYFVCFNRGEYYEAHDVLEHLWLSTTNRDWIYFKGLIQLAGGFVHLRHHFLHPDHPVHQRRLAPASRLFAVASRNLSPFRPFHMGLDIENAINLAESTAARIVSAQPPANPWNPNDLPQLALAASPSDHSPN